MVSLWRKNCLTLELTENVTYHHLIPFPKELSLEEREFFLLPPLGPFYDQWTNWGWSEGPFLPIPRREVRAGGETLWRNEETRKRPCVTGYKKRKKQKTNTETCYINRENEESRGMDEFNCKKRRMEGGGKKYVYIYITLNKIFRFILISFLFSRPWFLIK